jgi:hypothetical protein
MFCYDEHEVTSMDISFEVTVNKKKQIIFVPGITTWERLDGARDRLNSRAPHPTPKAIYVWVFFFIISGVGLIVSPLGTAATSGLLYKPQMIDENDCGAVGGMKIGRGNRSTRRKPTPAPLYPPQIPHDQTRARTRAAAVGSQRLTT